MLLLIQVLLDGLLLGGLYMLVALGLTLVFGVMNVVNLAHGEFLMVGGFLTYLLATHLHLSPWLTLPIAAAGLFVAAYLFEETVVERVVSSPMVMSLLLLFGLSAFLQSGGLAVWGATYRSVGTLQGSLLLGPIFIPWIRLAAFGIAAAATVLTLLFLRGTDLGREIRATAQNAQLAKACGVNVRRVRAFTFGMGAAMASLGGSLLIMLFAMNPASGQLYLAIAFAVAVVGGLGSLPGALLGAVVVGLVQTLVGFYATAQWANVAVYAVFLVVLIVRPQGLLGKRPAS